MRCKAGDLAIVVAPDPYAGRVVECAKVYGSAFWSKVDGPHWWVRPMSAWPTTDVTTNPAGLIIYPDSMLRPIRDNDRADETLTWKTKEIA